MTVVTTIITLVAAVAENGVIGNAGGLPWRLSTDLKRFKALTMGKPVIMGRKTWEGLAGPLPGRRNIVVTRDKGYEAAGAGIAHSLEEALTQAAPVATTTAAATGTDEVSIIGGGEIFR